MEDDHITIQKQKSINLLKMVGVVAGAVFLLCLWLGFAPSGMNPGMPSAKTVITNQEFGHAELPASQEIIKFNISDKSADTNGNLSIAVKAIQGQKNSDAFSKSEKVSASKLTKSPYSLLGKVVRLTGRIYKVEELPPNQHQSGSWSSILMMDRNQNSPLGATTVNFIFNGDTTNINSGQIVTCSGYFLGIYEAQNSLGGTVEGIALLGNHITRK